MRPLVLLFSGGKTSGMMTKLLFDKYKGKRHILVIFNNTGKETEQTLAFVNKCDREWGLGVVWLESVQYHGQRKRAGYKIVTFETASRNGEPFEDMIKKHGIPNTVFKHCTRELKTNPTLSYLEDIGLNDYEAAIGLRVDEPKRLTEKRQKIYCHTIFPLAYELPTTKEMVNKWWSQQPFNINIKGYQGNCDLCWKKSKRKHLTILLERPEVANWWNEMEIKYGEFVPPSQIAKRIIPITFFRGKESVMDLLEDSKFPFTPSEDDYSLNQLMFSEPELDYTDGCEESCEPFKMVRSFAAFDFYFSSN